VIADATFMDPAYRTEICRSAGAAPFLGVWLEAPLAILEARVAARSGDASDADLGVLRRAASAGAEAGDWTTVDAGAADVLAIVARHVKNAAGPC
jgi:predicted kinase